MLCEFIEIDCHASKPPRDSVYVTVGGETFYVGNHATETAKERRPSTLGSAGRSTLFRTLAEIAAVKLVTRLMHGSP